MERNISWGPVAIAAVVRHGRCLGPPVFGPAVCPTLPTPHTNTRFITLPTKLLPHTAPDQHTMIRLNPTSIRLRPSDVKALQDELERRREAAKATVNGNHANTSTTERRKDANTSRSRTARNNSSNNQNAPQPADAAVEERRRRRAAMTAQERIGYICELGAVRELWPRSWQKPVYVVQHARRSRSANRGIGV